MATGTLSPSPWFTGLDDNGDPLVGGKLYTYEAGTTTPLATYSDVGLTTPNTNPVILDSGGRCTLFLSATSYKYVLKTSADVTVRTQDNIGSVPSGTVDTDVPGTAGEALTATKVAYLLASTWFLGDADAAASSTLPPIGFVVSDIANGATGTFRTAGRMTGFSGLTPGLDYYVSGTAGEITATAPTNARYVGRADSISSLIISPNPRPASQPMAACGRLTLTSNTPVTTADVTAATTVYFTPYHGNTLSLFDGTAWAEREFAQLSIAVPATTATMYDVWAYDNAGVIALEINSTTRTDNTGLTLTNGVYLKTGALTRLYLGSFRTTAVSGQTEDSATKRLVWNYFNRRDRLLEKLITTDSYTYTTATNRQWEGSTSNQVEIVVGVSEDVFELEALHASTNTSANVERRIGIGEGSTTVMVSSLRTGINVASPVGQSAIHYAKLRKVPAVGYQFYAGIERSDATGISTWIGDNGGTIAQQSGLSGWIWG